MKLFVIPGHGAGDPGACAFGFSEAERVRELALRIKHFGGDNVILADFNRNYYADGGINYLNISKDIPIVELHMDAGSDSARGGHVIIQQGAGHGDQFDFNLRDFIGGFFPGRCYTLVERNDLANPYRAWVNGYNYRSVENGFITNYHDLLKFNKDMDELAKGYCKAFGLPIKEEKEMEEIKNLCKEIKEIISDKKDYSGRGKEGSTIFARIPFMAAKQEKMQQSIDILSDNVDTILRILTDKEQ